MGRAEADVYVYLVTVPSDMVIEAFNLLTTVEKQRTVPLKDGGRLVTFHREFDARAFTQILRENTGRFFPFAKASSS